MWVCVCVGFVICGCFDNCVGVLVICVLVFTVFCIVSLMSLFLFVTLPSENSIAVNNNNKFSLKH